MEAHTQGYFYIIPAELAEGGDPTKALLYGAIVSLARRDDDSGCTASNKYLASKLGRKSTRIITDLIAKLESEGWVRVSVDKKAGNLRHIYPIFRDTPPIAKKRYTYSEKTLYPYSEKTLTSNISNSSIREYLLSMSDLEKEKFLEELEGNPVESPEIKEISDYYKEKIGTQLEKEPKLSTKARDKIRTRLKTFTLDEIKKAIDNFAADWWWMENNGSRGMAWFFKTDDRIEQLINLIPRKNNGGQHNETLAKKWGKYG